MNICTGYLDQLVDQLSTNVTIVTKISATIPKHSTFIFQRMIIKPMYQL